MKKTVVFFFDCHGSQIMHYLSKNDEFNKYYNCKFISINEYVITNAELNNTSLKTEHINIISEADILILQVIEKDRNFLNNDKVIKFCKPNCEVIKIPHYRNSIYDYRILGGGDKYTLLKNYTFSEKIKDIDNIDETIKLIKNDINIMNESSHNLQNNEL